jgi:hypothetical protein
VDGGKLLNLSAPPQFLAPGAVAGALGLPPSTMSRVHLVEEKVFAQFKDEVKKDSKRWVLDGGTSNHMMGIREVFTDLDSNIRGTMRFGDGSMVEIEGVGTMMLVCKNGEHRSLTGVYLIPKLTTNNISLGQLDEIGYEVIISGALMRVRDDHSRLLAKVQWSSNRLYVLNLSIAQPMNLLVKGTEGAWLWHACFGHLNVRALRNLAREEMVRGLPEIEHIDQLGMGCLIGKQRWAPFPHQAEF